MSTPRKILAAWAARVLGPDGVYDTTSILYGDGETWDAAVETGLIVRYAGPPHEECDACADGECYVYAPGIREEMARLQEGKS